MLLFAWLGGKDRGWRWADADSFEPHNGAPFPAIDRARLLRTVGSVHFRGFGPAGRNGPRLR